MSNIKLLYFTIFRQNGQISERFSQVTSIQEPDMYETLTVMSLCHRYTRDFSGHYYSSTGYSVILIIKLYSIVLSMLLS